MVDDEIDEMRRRREADPAEMFGLDGDADDWRYAMCPPASGGLRFFEAGPESRSAEAFGWADVAQVFASSDGVNDGHDWLAVGELDDGRFFFLEAGCDYTGWG